MTDFNRHERPARIWTADDFDDDQDDGPVVAASVTIILGALFVLILLGAIGCTSDLTPSASEGCARSTPTGFAVDLHASKASCPDDPIQHKAVR